MKNRIEHKSIVILVFFRLFRFRPRRIYRKVILESCMRGKWERCRFLDWNSHVALLLALGDKSLIESRHRLREYRIPLCISPILSLLSYLSTLSINFNESFTFSWKLWKSAKDLVLMIAWNYVPARILLFRYEYRILGIPRWHRWLEDIIK